MSIIAQPPLQARGVLFAVKRFFSAVPPNCSANRLKKIASERAPKNTTPDCAQIRIKLAMVKEWSSNGQAMIKNEHSYDHCHEHSYRHQITNRQFPTDRSFRPQ